jgi:hypothetical protein
MIGVELHDCFSSVIASDLFKTTEDEFFMATEIVERSLIRRGWVQPTRILPPTYH